MLRDAGQPGQEREAQRHAAAGECQDGPECGTGGPRAVGHTGLLGPQVNTCFIIFLHQTLMYREAAFAVLNQETGPEIQSVYMTVAADLVLNQVRLVTSSKYPSITITKSLGFR